MAKKESQITGDLYELKVEVAPRAPLAPIEKSVAYQPIINGRDAELIEAKKAFRDAAGTMNRARHDRLVEVMLKRG